MTDFLTSVSPFLGFYIKACVVLTAIVIIMTIAFLVFALTYHIAKRRKKHGKR